MWPAACWPHAFQSYQPRGKVNTAVSLWLIFFTLCFQVNQVKHSGSASTCRTWQSWLNNCWQAPRGRMVRVLNFGVINQQCRKEVVLCSSLNTWHFRQETLTQKAELVFETRMRHLVRRFIFQQQYHDCAAKSCSEEKFWELNSSDHPIRPFVMFLFW